MKQLLVLDVFCGRGGAAMGMIQAGAMVIGVDIDPKCGDYYPGEFHQGRFEDIEKIVLLDSTKLIDKHFDLLWFSCPCQFATAMRNIRGKTKQHPNYIPAARKLALKLGIPYIIENVPPASYKYKMMRADVDLDGYMFGLRLDRHRVFECSFSVIQPIHIKTKDIPSEKRQLFSVVGRLVSTTKNGGHERYEQMKYWWPIEMGLFHIPLNITTWDGHNAFTEAIPPAFSKYLFEQFKLGREK
jgi:DNA (cytosine-5)-methyltransferase 1